MDYAVNEAVNSLNGSSSSENNISSVLLIYDIACQWVVHHRTRFQKSKHLDWPRGLALDVAVGKFHLGAHRDGCFAKFSLNLMAGAGHLDGEILESLWSFLNKGAGPTRVMTKAHRQEVLDDLMQDSNWKKMLKSGWWQRLYLGEY